MTIDISLAWLTLPFEIALLDLLLGGDNAIVIALACKGLPERYASLAMLYGTIAAILFRLLLTITATFLILIPFLKLASAVLLIIIAVRRVVRPGSCATDPSEALETFVPGPDASGLWSAVVYILLADAIMSLDNVVAVAAVAHGNIVGLALGLCLSIPLLVYGGLCLRRLLNSYLVLAAAGAVLGWVAGDLAVGDAAVAPWISAQAPALSVVAPILCAVFVVAEGAIVERSGLMTEHRRSDPGAAATAWANEPSEREVALASAVAFLPPPNEVPRRVLRRMVSLGAARSSPDLRLEAEPRTEIGSSTESQPADSDDRAVLVGILIMSGIAAAILVIIVFLGRGLA
jgi:YjbE family integral membrane protein